MDDVSLPRWTVIIVLPLFVISTILAACFGQSIGTNGIQILTILASTQAAIFAIVFSIIILGIQLSASGYSPRLVNLFREDDAYRFTAALFGASIGVDVLGLYLFAVQDSFLYETYLSGAGALAVGSLGVLYLFVDRTLYQSTPEGILTRLREQLSPEWTIQQARLSHENSAKRDPYQLLLSVIDSAVEARDSPTISQGLDLITDRVGDLLEVDREETSDSESPVAGSIEDLCTDRLPALLERTARTSQEVEARAAVECLDALGKVGVEKRVGYVVESSSEGLSKPVGSLDYSELEERVRKETIDTNGELLAKSTEAALWKSTDNGVRLLGWRVAQSIMERSAQNTHDTGYTSLLTLNIPRIHKNASKVSPTRTDDNVDWLLGEDANHEEVRAHEGILQGCYFAMYEITSAAIRNEIETGTSVVKWSRIAAGWDSCLTDLRNSNYELLFQLWLGTILYIEYLASETDEEVLTGINRLSIRHGFRGHVSEVVDSIQSRRIRPRARIDALPGAVNPVEIPFVSVSSQLLTDPDITFSDWLEFQRGMSGMDGFVE